MRTVCRFNVSEICYVYPSRLRMNRCSRCDCLMFSFSHVTFVVHSTSLRRIVRAVFCLYFRDKFFCKLIILFQAEMIRTNTRFEVDVSQVCECVKIYLFCFEKDFTVYLHRQAKISSFVFIYYICITRSALSTFSTQRFANRWWLYLHTISFICSLCPCMTLFIRAAVRLFTEYSWIKMMNISYKMLKRNDCNLYAAYHRQAKYKPFDVVIDLRRHKLQNAREKKKYFISYSHIIASGQCELNEWKFFWFKFWFVLITFEPWNNLTNSCNDWKL